MAEGEGFEPPVPLARDNGFQNRRFRPLSHPSALCRAPVRGPSHSAPEDAAARLAADC